MPLISGVERMLTGLLCASDMASVERLPSLASKYAAHAGLHEVLIYLADLQQDHLLLLGDGQENPPSLRIDGTLAGRAYQSMRPLCVPRSGGGEETWWVPLLEGSERLGLLRARARPGGEVPVPRALGDLAALVALMLVSSRGYSDSYACLVRRRSMNIAAEMQWNLMPPLTSASDEVVIGAVLEPAYEISGDAFDYALSGDTVHLGVFDAMGHDTAAGLTANLAVAAWRNHRREGGQLDTVGRAIEKALTEQFAGTRYTTAVLAELQTHTGILRWVNFGHHYPALIREGHLVATLECRPGHPLGTALDLPTTVCRAQLQPGDRVLLYTDGITEARNTEGQEFGLARFVDFVIRHDAAGLPVPETLRRLIHNVLEYHHSRLLDDATVLLMEWRGTARRRLRGERC